MTGWRTGILREVCNISTGFAFKGEQYESSGSLRVVRGENVTIGTLRWDSEKHWNHSSADLENYLLSANDIVIGMDGSRVGHNRAKIRAVDLPLILAQRVARLRAKNGFDQDFIWYQIIDDRFKDYVEAIHTGTSIPHISMNQIGDYEVTLPPFPEQKAIAALLSSLDDKIDLLHRQNKTLEAMAETLFRKWFVEEAQEDWEVVKLGDFFPVVTGKKDANFSTDDGEYPFFTCSQTAIKAPSFSFDGAAILLSGNGDFNVKRYIGKFEAYQRTYVLMPYEVKYLSFLFTLMRYFLSDITGGHQGSVINFITKGMITDFTFSMPNDRGMISDKLEQFNEMYEKVDSNTWQISTLKKLRDNLLPKLMNGEVRVA